MTESRKRMVRESFHSVREISGPLATLFYGRLFEVAPETRSMFHGGIARQGAKLMEMLTAVVDHLDRFEELDPVLREMGRRHAGYGVTQDQYALVARALVWALNQALDGTLDREQRAAWEEVLARISATMLEGARAAGT